MPVWIPKGPAPQSGNDSIGIPGPDPVTGRISALAFEPLAGGHSFLWVGAAGGGLWQSGDIDTENPPNYIPMTDLLGTLDLLTGLGAGLIDIGSIAIDTQHPERIYVGTGEANYSADSRYGSGVFGSINNGNDFQTLATGTVARPRAFFRQAISKIIVDPRNSNTLYVAVTGLNVAGGDTANKGIYVGTRGPGGWTFQQVAGGGTGIGPNIDVSDLDYTFDAARGSLVLYAGVRYPPQPAGVPPAPDTFSGIWRSTNNGRDWQELNAGGALGTGLPPRRDQYQRIALAADHASGHTTVYAAYVDKNGNLLGVYRYPSVNPATDWSSTNLPNPATVTEVPGDGKFGWYALALGLAPDGRLYLGGCSYMTGPGGARAMYQLSPTGWHSVDPSGDPNGPHVDIHAFAFWNGQVYVATDGGLWRFSPPDFPAGGPPRPAVWENLNAAPLSTIQAYSVTINPRKAAILLEGSQDNGTARTTNPKFAVRFRR